MSPSRRAAVLAVLIATVGAGLAASEMSAIGTLHAVACVCALAVAIVSRRLTWVAYAAAYTATSDVLWRMSDAAVPWDSGKYMVALSLIAAVVSWHLRTRQTSIGVLYFLLLLPGGAAALFAGGMGAFEGARAQLAGPLVIAAAIGFFGSVLATSETVENILWAAVAPTAAVAAVAARSTFFSGPITFTTESSFASAGGFGPNQVSTLIGFGALCFVLLALTERNIAVLVVEVTAAVALAAQAALTFSRGGIFALVLAFFAALAVSVTRLLRGPRLLVGAVALLWVSSAFLVPRLVEFTDGALGNRYADRGFTNREEIAAADVELFERHPIGGLGAGRSTDARFEILGYRVAPHNEFTRALAEHGVFGVAALAVLAGALLLALVSAAPGYSRASVAALGVWAASTMTHSATRLASVGLAVGLACLLARAQGRTDAAGEVGS